jgi:hypothetical protein
MKIAHKLTLVLAAIAVVATAGNYWIGSDSTTDVTPEPEPAAPETPAAESTAPTA